MQLNVELKLTPSPVYSLLNEEPESYQNQIETCLFSMEEKGLFSLDSYGKVNSHLQNYEDLMDLSSHEPNMAWVAMQRRFGRHLANRFLKSKERPDVSGRIISSKACQKSLIQNVDGGITLSGRWNFLSGVLHADQVGLLSRKENLAKGSLELNYYLVNISDVTVLDNWNVHGLKETQSRSIVLDNVFVPRNNIGTATIVDSRYRSHPPNNDKELLSLRLLGLLEVGACKEGLVKKFLREFCSLGGRRTEVKNDLEERFCEIQYSIRATLANLSHNQFYESIYLYNKFKEFDDIVTKIVQSSGTRILSLECPLMQTYLDLIAVNSHQALSNSGLNEFIEHNTSVI